MKWIEKDSNKVWQTEDNCFALEQISQGHTANLLEPDKKKYQLLWHNGIEWRALAFFITNPSDLFTKVEGLLDMLRKDLGS